MVPSSTGDTHMTKRKTAAAARPPKTPQKKTDTVVALLKRKDGASLAEITGTTGWQPHSARAVLTGFRKKGYAIEKSKAEGVTRWSITGGPAQ
jgi:hypothetical protein